MTTLKHRKFDLFKFLDQTKRKFIRKIVFQKNSLEETRNTNSEIHSTSQDKRKKRKDVPAHPQFF